MPEKKPKAVKKTRGRPKKEKTDPKSLMEEIRAKRRLQSDAQNRQEVIGHSLAKEDCRALAAGMMHTLAASVGGGEEVARVLKDSLQATILVKLKDCDGNETVIETPDHKTRISGAVVILDYCVGKAVQRQETVNYNFDMSELNPAQLIEQLATSPATLDKVKEMVKIAESKQSEMKPANVQNVN